jgi:hypothetical protein
MCVGLAVCVFPSLQSANNGIKRASAKKFQHRSLANTSLPVFSACVCAKERAPASLFAFVYLCMCAKNFAAANREYKNITTTNGSQFFPRSCSLFLDACFVQKNGRVRLLIFGASDVK